MSKDRESVIKALNESLVILSSVQFSMRRIDSDESLKAYQAVSLAVRSFGKAVKKCQ